jgi:pyruvate kinase
MKVRTLALSAAVARGVREMVDELKPRLVVVYSQTGATARIFSKYRFKLPIIALSADHRALRRMALHYGVVPQEMPTPIDMRDLVAKMDALVRDRKFADVGDRVVLVAGASLGTPGTMNSVIIHTVGDAWLADDQRESNPSMKAEASV